MPTSQCAICSDLFDGVERVMAAPCGHVYHSKCLLKWLDVKKSCPECRQKVERPNVLELYFNVNFTQLVNPTSLSNEIENLKALLQESRTEASRLINKNKELNGIIVKDLATIHTLQQTNMDLEQKLRNSMIEIPILKHRLEGVKAENETIKRELCLLEDIKTVVTGTQKDADEILDQAVSSATHGRDLLIAKRLAYCCSLTKRELKRTIDEKNKLRNETIEINKNLGLTSSKLRLSKALVKKLEKKVEQLESAAKRNISNYGSEFNDSLNPEPTTSNDSPCPKQSSNISSEMTPITAGSENKEKRKLNVVVLDKEREKISVACNQSVSPLNFSLIAKRKKETNSVSNIGYNGLGGHHSIIVRADDLPTAGRSKKFLVPTKKKFRKLRKG